MIETPITLPPLPDIFISSPTVDCSRRFGDAPSPVEPRSLNVSSDTLVTRFFVARSHHSLPIMPLSAGVAPVRNVECPTAVTVGTCS